MPSSKSHPVYAIPSRAFLVHAAVSPTMRQIHYQSLTTIPAPSKEHHPGAILAIIALATLRRLRNRAVMRKEQELNRQRQPRMQAHNHDQQHLADLAIRGTQHWVQIAQKERHGHAEADSDEDPVQDLNR